MSRHFTAEEIEEYVFEGDVVYEEDNGSGRWSESVTSVFRADDGKLYEANWERGLTEMQDNEFYDATLDEVFPVSKVSAKIKTIYSKVVDEDTQFAIDTESLNASTIVSGDAEAGLAAIKSFNTEEVLEFLKNASTAILPKNETAFLEASRQFFTAIQKIQKDM